MLLGQNLRRSHDASLVVIVKGNEHRHQRHQCLPRSHIPLQQSVHLSSASHIRANLPYHPFLCICQRKGQVPLVELVEDAAHMLEHISVVFPSVVAGVAHNVQLHVEQLLELQSYTRMSQLFGSLGIVDMSEGRIARNQSQTVGNKRRQSLRQRVGKLFQHTLHDLLDGP